MRAGQNLISRCVRLVQELVRLEMMSLMSSLALMEAELRLVVLENTVACADTSLERQRHLTWRRGW